VPLELISPTSTLTSVLPAFALLNVISLSLLSLSELLVSSLAELEEEPSLPQEVADAFKPEILPDSELDEDEASASMSTSGGVFAS
jgi:hypothetical protein